MIPIRVAGVVGGRAPRARPARLLALLAWPLLGALLGGCAAASRGGASAAAPAPAAPPAYSAAARQAPESPRPAAALSPAGVASSPDGAALDMPAIATMLRQVSAMTQSAASARQRELQAPSARRGPGQRLELAYLLIARAAPTLDEAARAHDLLRGLDAQTGDAASRQFIRVLQRLSLQTVELLQSRADLAKAQRKVADLQDKIGQIKNLEVQLQGRSQDRGSRPQPKTVEPRPAGRALP